MSGALGKRVRHEVGQLAQNPASPCQASHERESVRLTSRETEIAELASRGLRNLEIAGLCRCSVYTVRNHLVAIFRKLEVTTRAELAMLVVESRLSGERSRPTGSSARGE